MKLLSRFVFTSSIAALAGTGFAPAAANEPGAMAGVDPALAFVSVDDALAAVKAYPDIKIVQRPNGWLVATEADGLVRWSFAPIGHPAHPAVIRQVIRDAEGQAPTVEMSALCQAKRSACLRLIDEFKIAGERLRQTGPRRFE